MDGTKEAAVSMAQVAGLVVECKDERTSLIAIYLHCCARKYLHVLAP
jgi:hypothetical protein